MAAGAVTTPAAVRDEAGVGHQVVGRGRRYPCRDGVAWLDGHLAGRDVHEPAVAGTSGEAPGGAVLAPLAGADQHLDLAPDQSAAGVPGDLILQRDEPLVALLHDRLGYLAVHRGGRRAGALRVLERERARESRLAHDVQRLLEVVVGLAGEADDDVSRDRG